jgi:hypothetical protein
VLRAPCRNIRIHLMAFERVALSYVISVPFKKGMNFLKAFERD